MYLIRISKENIPLHLSIFKKKCYHEFHDNNEKLLKKEIHEKFDNLSDEEKMKIKIQADTECMPANFLWDEVKEALLRTNGKVSYQALCSYLKGIICVNTLRKFLKSIEGFKLQRNRVLPHLHQAHKEKRLAWAKMYITFWSAVKKIPHEKCLYILLHMDEKWFYACRSRGHNKVLTSIGLFPSNYYVHHKSHVNKQMFICATAFIPYENDITRGGEAIPISLIRVGEEGVWEKNTYKRVYDSNGNYSMPRNPSNIKNIAGESRFISGNLTGSSDGRTKDGNLNVSLLSKYRDDIIPALEKMIANKGLDLNSNGEKRKVRVVLQEDGAGPHQEVKYVRWMNENFCSRGWIRFNQPPQSPITNVHDSCIFPMLSKFVSREQGLRFGSRLLVANEINEIVNKLFYDEKNILAMSRAFVANHQVALAIIHYKGCNTYLRDNGGLHFGVRKSVINDKNGKGVIVLNHAPVNESQTQLGGMMRSVKGFRYKCPDIIKGFDEHAELSDEMKKILKVDFKSLDVTQSMNHEEFKFWMERFRRTDGLVSVHNHEDSDDYTYEEDSIIDWDEFEQDELDEQDEELKDNQLDVLHDDHVDHHDSIPVHI